MRNAERGFTVIASINRNPKSTIRNRIRNPQSAIRICEVALSEAGAAA
jgi:hypothetical protein